MRITQFPLLIVFTISSFLSTPSFGKNEPIECLNDIKMLLLNSPLFRSRVQRFSQKQEFISDGRLLDDIQNGRRYDLQSIVRDRATRRLLRATLIQRLRDRSRLLGQAMLRATDKQDNEFFVYDYLVIGAGVQSSIFSNGMRESGSNLKGLVVEKSDSVASTFASSPDFFRINSTNRADIAGQRVAPGEGNLNRFPGSPIQIPDMEATVYPPARAVADTALISQASSDVPVLFKTEVLAVVDRKLLSSDNDNIARYSVKMRYTNPDTGETSEITIFTNNIVNASGLGEEAIRIDPSNLPTVKAITDTFEDFDFSVSSEAPNIMTFNQARKAAQLSLDPMLPYRNKDVLIVGTGDSAKVTIEFLFGQAPEEIYKQTPAQAGKVRKVIWAGQSAENCEEYITQNRVRYAPIAGPIKSDVLIPNESKVTQVTPLSNNKYNVMFENGTTQIVDRIIFATGFESQTREVYKDVISKIASANKFIQQLSTVIRKDDEKLPEFDVNEYLNRFYPGRFESSETIDLLSIFAKVNESQLRLKPVPDIEIDFEPGFIPENLLQTEFENIQVRFTPNIGSVELISPTLRSSEGQEIVSTGNITRIKIGDRIYEREELESLTQEQFDVILKDENRSEENLLSGFDELTNELANSSLEKSDRLVDILGDIQDGFNTVTTVIAKRLFRFTTESTNSGINLEVSPQTEARLIPQQDIYFLGPMVNLVTDAERSSLLAGVNQNEVSIFVNGPRSFSFGQFFAEAIESLRLPKINFTKLRNNSISIVPEKIPRPVKISLNRELPPGRFFPEAGDDLILLNELANLFKGRIAESINIQFLRREEAINLEIEQSYRITQSQKDEIENYLNSENSIIRQLVSLMLDKESDIIEVRLEKSGRNIDLSSSSIMFKNP